MSKQSSFGAPWVGSSSTISTYERWYVQRSEGNNYNYVESAADMYYYWRHTSTNPIYLATSYGSASRYSFQYFPCDKVFGWDW